MSEWSQAQVVMLNLFLVLIININNTDVEVRTLWDNASLENILGFLLIPLSHQGLRKQQI